MAHVARISHYLAPGWHGDLEALKDQKAYHPVVPLHVALRETYSSAPLMQMAVVRNKDTLQVGDEQPRLTKNAEAAKILDQMGLEVVFEAICFDIDHKQKDTHGKASVEWRRQQYKLLRKIPEGYGFYETAGGYRLLWELPSPLKVPEYETLWRNLRDHLASILEVDDATEVDEKCKDWTRLFYLPFITKPGHGDLRMAHDFDDMGVLNWVPPVVLGSPDLSIFDARGPGFVLPDLIPDGQRNSTLFSYAASLRARGGTYESILEKVTLANEERCNPPVEPAELVTIAQSVLKYPVPDPARYTRTPDTFGVNPADAFYSPPERTSADVVSGQVPVLKLGDEAELAELLLSKFEDNNVACVYTRGKLHTYNKALGYWEAIPTSTLLAVVQTFSGLPIDSGHDKDGHPKVRPLKISANSAKGAILLAKSMRDRGQDDFFNSRVAGVSFRNGFVRIDNGAPELIAPQPEFRTDVFLDYEYVPNANPALFQEFLNDLFVVDVDCQDKIKLVREFFGAAIAGQMTRYAKALLLVGDGSNGKSTLLQIIEALFPSSLRASVLPHDMSRGFARAALTGKTINIVTEMSKNAILDSEGFKAIVSGDQIQAEEKHGQPFVFKPTAAHVFAANTLPAVADSSDGFWRRWLVVDFNRTFTRLDAKPGLAEAIIREELGLIASWLIDAASAVWERRFFAETEAIAQRRRTWRGESDAIQMFLTDMLEDDAFGFGRPEPGDDMFVENNVLYQKYQLWSQMTGMRSRGQTTLSRELLRLGVQKDRRKGKRGFVLPTSVGTLRH